MGPMTVQLLVITAIIATSFSVSESSEPFPVTAISEVEFKGGLAHATSNFDQNHWTAEKAFIIGYNKGWHNGPAEYGNFPQMIWYDFAAVDSFVPARVTFRTRADGDGLNYREYGPSIWQFVGSNDSSSCSKGGNWTVLCEDLSDVGYRHKFTTKFCDVDAKIMRKFRCLGILILNNHQPAGAVAVREIRMWKKVLV